MSYFMTLTALGIWKEMKETIKRQFDMSLRSCRKLLKYLRRSFNLFAVYFSKSQ